MPDPTTTTSTLRDAADTDRAAKLAALQAQEAALEAQVATLTHPTFITRDSAGTISRFTAPSDAAACARHGDPSVHRHGRADQQGACMPLWRLDRGADGIVRQVAVNECSRSRGGDGEGVPVAWVVS